MKQTQIIVAAVVALLVGVAGGFAGGVQFQKSRAATTGNFANGGNFAGRGNGARGQFGRNGMNAVRGSIVSVSDNTLTVQLPDGSSKIVILGTAARVEQTQQASAADLKTGEQVLVLGITNSDGSVTAQNVQINPAFGAGGSRPSPIPTAQSY